MIELIANIFGYRFIFLNVYEFYLHFSILLIIKLPIFNNIKKWYEL